MNLSTASPAGTCRRRSCGRSASHLRRPGRTAHPHRDRDPDRHRPPPRGRRRAAAGLPGSGAGGAPVLVYDNHKAHRLGRRLPIPVSHRRSDPRPAAARPRPVPAHPARRAEAAAHRLGQPGRPPPADRLGAVGRAPRLDHLAAAAAAGRRRRIRQGPRSSPTPTGTPTPSGTPMRASRSTCSPSCSTTAASTSPAATTGSAKTAAALPSTRSPPCSSTGTATAIWRDARALLDDEHARYAVGSVAVPYGTCTEPSNVAAGGDRLPAPVPLRRLRPLPHRRLLPPRPDRLPR